MNFEGILKEIDNIAYDQSDVCKVAREVISRVEEKVKHLEAASNLFNVNDRLSSMALHDALCELFEVSYVYE